MFVYVYVNGRTLMNILRTAPEYSRTLLFTLPATAICTRSSVNDANTYLGLLVVLQFLNLVPEFGILFLKILNPLLQAFHLLLCANTELFNDLEDTPQTKDDD